MAPQGAAALRDVPGAQQLVRPEAEGCVANTHGVKDVVDQCVQVDVFIRLWFKTFKGAIGDKCKQNCWPVSSPVCSKKCTSVFVLVRVTVSRLPAHCPIQHPGLPDMTLVFVFVQCPQPGNTRELRVWGERRRRLETTLSNSVNLDCSTHVKHWVSVLHTAPLSGSFNVLCQQSFSCTA